LRSDEQFIVAFDFFFSLSLSCIVQITLYTCYNLILSPHNLHTYSPNSNISLLTNTPLLALYSITFWGLLNLLSYVHLGSYPVRNSYINTFAVFHTPNNSSVVHLSSTMTRPSTLLCLHSGSSLNHCDFLSSMVVQSWITMVAAFSQRFTTNHCAFFSFMVVQ
jgi:hypothetical protein